jgi:uncharacterized protein
MEMPNNLKSLWLKVVRKLDAIEIFYSFYDKTYTTMRLAYFPDKKPVIVGMAAALADGEGFNTLFEDFKINHIPDKRRLILLGNNK